MTKLPLAFALSLSGFLFLTPTSAQTLTFAGGPCVDPLTNNNGVCDVAGEEIDPAHGDAAGLIDVVYDGGGGANMFFWTNGYSGLTGVAYGQPGLGSAEISLIPEPGKVVSLDKFDVGSATTSFAIQINASVIDIGSGSTLFSGISVPVNAFTSAHSFAGLGLSSADGLTIRFDRFDTFAGIDNITFSVTDIPEPSAALLLLTGLAAVGHRARR